MLWLPLPDRLVKHTLNMTGFKARRETRTAAPDWLDWVQARVARDRHSNRRSPAPAPCSPRPAPTPAVGAAQSTTTTLQNTYATSSSSLNPAGMAAESPSWPISPYPSLPRWSPASTCSVHLRVAPWGRGAPFPPATPLSSSSVPLVVLQAFQRTLSALDVVWLGCLFSYWRFYDRVGNEP